MPKISQYPLQTAPNTDSDIAIEYGVNYRFKYGKLFPVTAIGDIIYANSLTSYVALPIGTERRGLAVASGVPAWEEAAQPFCVVGKSVAQSVADNTETLLTWDVDVSDDPGWHDTVTNNHIIMPSAGFYQISLFYDSEGTGGVTGTARWTTRMYYGASVVFANRMDIAANTFYRFECITTPIIQLNGVTGIYWTLHQTDGAARDVNVVSRLSVKKIR